MRIRNFFFIAALATIAIVGCSKDDDTPSDAVDMQPGQNELVMDGARYALTTSASTDAENSYLQFACQNAADPALFSLNGSVYAYPSSAFNKTFNVAVQNPDVHFGFDFYSESPILPPMNYDNWSEGIHGTLDGQLYENESIWSSGSATITFDDNGFRFAIYGTLKNGKKCGFIAYVPRNEIVVQ